MTLQAFNGDLYWPPALQASGVLSAVAFTNAGTVDLAGEQIAFIGRVWWNGSPGSAKTFSTASKIHFRTGTVTFADAGTTLRIGIQDIDPASGATGGPRPDGTHDVYTDVIGNGGVITSADDAVVKSITMASGTKSIAHGAFIAVVFDMTARAGSDSVIVTCYSSGSSAQSLTATYTGGAWSHTTTGVPMVLLEADDGTLGVLRGSGPMASATANYSFSAASNPDERGLIFQVPFRCTASGVVGSFTNGASASGDATVRLYSTPLGTPSSMASVSYTGDEHINTQRLTRLPIDAQTLEPNTDYCVAVEATGASSITMAYLTVNADHRSISGLTNCRLGYRQNQTGAFSETTTEIPILGVLITALDDGAGGGGSGGGPLVGGRLVR